MKTIETTATVDQKGKLTIELTSDLPPGNHRAVIVVDDASPTAWTVLRDNAGTVEMPEDWAKEHDHYLYGTPKREV